jgi:hypothetical protein
VYERADLQIELWIGAFFIYDLNPLDNGLNFMGSSAFFEEFGQLVNERDLELLKISLGLGSDDGMDGVSFEDPGLLLDDGK